VANPYADAKDYQLWRRAVSSVEPHLFNPVICPRVQIRRHARIATAGSCFAQNISRELQRIGFNYFIADRPADLDDAEAKRHNFGVYSARYGNIYTARQLLQLFQEAVEHRHRADKAWQRPDGRYVDPFRPLIEPDGYPTADAVVEARTEHLKDVRKVFLEADFFIFTLGLTECWESKSDGSVYPLAPGVSAGSFDPQFHAFRNLTVGEVEEDLTSFLRSLKAVNPSIRVLLSVSPVPMIATYEDRNVLVSNVYSKSVLRVAAGQAPRQFDWVDYYPAYELVVGSQAGGLYYQDDYREVNSAGVAHAMRCFVDNYVVGDEGRSFATQQNVGALESNRDELMCDEREIEALRR
jgi:hypothetical protein